MAWACLVSGNRNQKTAADTQRVFMTRTKFVLVAWFEIPAESMLFGWPTHEVRGNFSADWVHLGPVCVRLNPLRTNPQHELHFVGNRPGLLKQKIDAPFR